MKKSKNRPAKNRAPASKKGTPKTTSRPREHNIGDPQDLEAHDPTSCEEGSVTKLTFPVVGMGGSAGGIEAYMELLEELPSNTGMAFVLITHLTPDRESKLPELLSKSSKMRMVSVRTSMAIEPDAVYIIPHDHDLTIKDGSLRAVARTSEFGRHMPIDLFLRSLAEDQGSNAVGVILSGANADGAAGMRAIKAEGGITLVQDPKSARVAEMPEASIQAADPVDFILSPKQMALELVRISKHPYMRDRIAERDADDSNNTELAKIFSVLKSQKSVDFSGYKSATISRRIRRRMVLHRYESLAEYYKLLKSSPPEIDRLYDDLLINVTNFFRDPETYEHLRNKIFPEILKRKAPGSPIRLWIPGCSTGEEAYSLAMTLNECLLSEAVNHTIQIFATDLSDSAIDHARAGVYTDAIKADVPPDLIKKYFIHGENGLFVNLLLRESCIFARHDVTRDPPFSRMDVISCRNLLIYLGPTLQKRVLTAFGYALNPEGFLVLGRSETVGASTNAFELVDKKNKTYRRKMGLGWVPLDLTPALPPSNKTAVLGRQISVKTDYVVDMQNEADRIVIGRYAPVGAVLSEDFQIIQFRGQTVQFFEPPPGEPNFNVFRMARGDLQFELRALLKNAKRSKKPVRRENLNLEIEDQTLNVNLEVIPLKAKLEGRGYLLLIEKITTSRRKKTKVIRLKKNDVHRKLKDELQSTRDYLNSNIQDLESANEELQSANEEILSSNEELQSTNEEVGTAKEELQSMNEELITVNEELSKRNQQLSEANNDLSNLLNSVNLPIIMVGADLRIRRFTPKSEKILNVIPTDIGRPIMDLRPNFELPELEKLIFDTLDTMTTKEIELIDRDHRKYSLRIQPYRTSENRIDGAVLIFVDMGIAN